MLLDLCVTMLLFIALIFAAQISIVYLIYCFVRFLVKE